MPKETQSSEDIPEITIENSTGYCQRAGCDGDMIDIVPIEERIDGVLRFIKIRCFKCKWEAWKLSGKT